MVSLARVLLVGLLIIGAARGVRAQDLPPALADRFAEGVAALKAGDLDAAERALRDVLARGGDRPFVHHNLGIVLEQRERHTAALAEFRAAARLDPSFGPARLLAGTTLVALGRPKEAMVELQRAARLMPRDVPAHRALADACERAGDVPCLARELQTISGLAPGDPEALYRLGKAYLRLSQWSYERLRAVDPKSARLSEALGRELLDQGRLDEALHAFQQAVELDPSLPGIHLALARIHADRGRLDDALAEVDRELAILPESAKARELKAQIEAAQGKAQ